MYLPRDDLVDRVSEDLAIDREAAGRSLESLLEQGAAVEESAHDGQAAIYLPAFRAAEDGVAGRLRQLLAARERRGAIDVERALTWFESRLDFWLASEQRDAIRHSLTARVLVITGGPGTGKTTLIKGVVEILTKKGQQVLLAAPTGRAAKRLSEATGSAAKTIHRLLEFDPRATIFQRNRDRPLEADVVIVDEASMLDCLLFHNLLEAIPDRTRLILVGDVDQLPSVGPGKVLSDLIRSRRLPVARLTEIFRQAAASLIVRNAHRINHGEMPELDPRSGEADFYFIERREPEHVLETIKYLITQRIPRRFHLDPREEVQILTPMRRGLLGASNLNVELQALLNPHGAIVTSGARDLRVGDRVMQIRNNYDLEVFNGDVGRVEATFEAENKTRVRFDDRGVVYEAEKLDELMLAYACSVHKAQGSEYACVVVPLHTQHRVMLQRNLLYTAITRARRLLVLVGSRQAVGLAVRNAKLQHRFTRLAERLRGA